MMTVNFKWPSVLLGLVAELTFVRINDLAVPSEPIHILLCLRCNKKRSHTDDYLKRKKKLHDLKCAKVMHTVIYWDIRFKV